MGVCVETGGAENAVMLPTPPTTALLAIATLIMSSALLSQQTIIVSGGAGALNTALSSASPGDTLIVRAGSYDGAAVQKGVTIKCEMGVKFVTQVPNTLVNFQVSNVQLGQRCVVVGAAAESSNQRNRSGIAIENSQGTVILRRSSIVANAMSSSLDVKSCSGPVIIERISGSTAYQGGTSFVVTDSASVTVTDAQFSRMETSRSNVALERCKMHGMYIYPGLRVNSGVVSASACEFHGADLHIGMMWTPGIYLGAASLTLSRGTRVVHGTGGLPPRPAIDTGAGGTIRLDPSVQLIHEGVDITGPATVIRSVVPSVAISSPISSGSPIAVRTDSEPGSFTATFLSLIRPPLSLPFGSLWVHPQSPIFDSGLVPASGYRSLTRLVPPLAQHTALVMQPITLTTSGQIAMGTPAPFVIN